MPIPGIPLPGTGNPNPILSVEQYQRITADIHSENTLVKEAIADAVTMISVQNRRTFEYGQYFENLYLYKLGMCFPSATPIDGTKPIDAGTGAIYTPTHTQGPGSIIQGAGVWVGWFTPLPWMPVWTGVIPPQNNLKYWGGYHPYQTRTGETPPIPAKLARVFARVAYYILHPAIITPYGATSVSMGGISMSGSLSSMMAYDPQLKKDIQGFRRAMVHDWEQ